ncbi:MAG TPA: oligosaccharide flippase family protein, partial [Gemmatimonadaceae bacterium]|nr:oligosaccharide flippase family protein [Gemmatimonadaceae bacterium]
MTDASPVVGDREAPRARPGLGRRFLALGAGESIARLCTFALTVYLARALSPALYGIIGVAMGVMLYLTQLADGGLELVGVPAIARARDRVVEVAAPILALRFVFATALTLVVIVVGVAWVPQPDGVILAVSALALLAAGLSTRWIHLGLEQSGSIAAARTVGEVIALTVAIALVRDAGDVARVPLAQFLGATTTSLIMLVALKRQGISIPWRWDPSEAVPLYRRARTLLAFTLLGLLLFNFDLIFLRIVSGPEVS